MRFRKKPVKIEAIQNNTEEDALNMGIAWGENFDNLAIFNEDDGTLVAIGTLEGVMRVNKGDWIIKGVNGEFYPCKPDIFNKIYERVEEAE